MPTDQAIHASHTEASSSEEKAMVDSPPDSAKTEKSSESSDEDNVERVAGVKLIVLMTSLTLACFLVLLDSSILSTAIPRITDTFHSLSDIGWYGSAYQLGRYYSHIGRSEVFFVIFELGSVLCGAAQSSAMLIVGRTVAGIGASGLMNGSFTIISASVPLEKRHPLTGLLMGVTQLGVLLGPLIGGAFTTANIWRWCFYINIPLGALVAMPLLFMHIPEQVAKKSAGIVLRNLHHHLDLIGLALFAPAIVQLLLALQFGGNQFTWDSSQVIGLFCGAGVTFMIWVVWNYHQGDDALIPFPIIRRRTVWMSGVNYTFLMSTMFGASYFLPIYFQAVKGVSAIMSGVYLLATVLPQVFSAVLSGVAVSKVGYVPPFAIFSGTLTSIGSGLYALLQPDTPTSQWVGFQVLTGFGRGIGFQMPIVAIQHAVSPEELSTALAFIVWCQYIGPTIFLTLYNTIFYASLRSQLREQAPNADIEAILTAGATEFRKVASARDLPGVLIAYSNSLDRVFYLVAAAGVVVFCTSWGMGWKDIRKSKAT
ncbi:hypothetical protein G7Z17_g3328 [Cylindrodendrum hubeiense]|uniref:Major facilitator superfamily (MFS) profile domain-containing protein n=1 Tax=Cylindrodendrum hubeiense TaxID=595255 RepID=A0A9P5HLF9_9HYPO|nr:hypothetical protein G7Z17_g3328 [Cylindrodendrum hubeiense]